MIRFPGSVTLPAMKCQRCSEEIGDDFLAAWEKNPRSVSGLFRCPHCSADDVRREIGKTAEGKPLYTFRLWGPPTSSRRKKPGP